MADPRKVTDLDPLTTPAAADLIHLVDDVAGTPTSKKVVISDLFVANVLHYGAKGDGVTDDIAAFNTAIAVSKHVIAPRTGSGYVIGTTISLTTNGQKIEIFDDITYTGAATTALFKVDGVSLLDVSCYATTKGNDDNYCVLFENGTVNKFNFNETVGFLIHFAFIQAVGGQAAGHSLVENQIFYHLMNGFDVAQSVSLAAGEGVLFRNTTGDATIAMEGTELHGGFIWRFAGHGVHVENNVNAKYIQAYGVIDNADGGGQDYTVDSGSQQTSANLYLKFIREAQSTFGDGDILLNGRIAQIFINSESLAVPVLDVKATTGGTLTIPAVKLIASVKGGVTEATRYFSLLAGTNEGLSEPEDGFIGSYYDPGTSTPPVSTDAKLAGILAAFRRDDDASAIEGGNVEFRKRASANTIDLFVTLMNAASRADKFMVKAEGGIGISNTVVNANTPSGATARAMEIFDETGSSLGFIPIYAAEW